MCFWALTHCLWASQVCTIRGIGPQISRRALRRPWSLHSCCNIWTYGCQWLKAAMDSGLLWLPIFLADTLTRLFQECELLDAFIGEMQAGTLHSGRWWWRSQRCTESVTPNTSSEPMYSYHGLLIAGWLCHTWDQLRICFGDRTDCCLLCSLVYYACLVFTVFAIFALFWSHIWKYDAYAELMRI